MATREEYIEAAGGFGRAMAFEAQVLSIGDEFLPTEARDVRDEKVKVPSSEYWGFLIQQLGGAGT